MPVASVAVTVSAIVFATSRATRVYVAEVEPWIGLQRAPLPSQRYHRKPYRIAPVPAHVPVRAVSLRPTAAQVE